MSPGKPGAAPPSDEDFPPHGKWNKIPKKWQYRPLDDATKQENFTFDEEEDYVSLMTPQASDTPQAVINEQEEGRDDREEPEISKAVDNEPEEAKDDGDEPEISKASCSTMIMTRWVRRKWADRCDYTHTSPFGVFEEEEEDDEEEKEEKEPDLKDTEEEGENGEDCIEDLKDKEEEREHGEECLEVEKIFPEQKGINVMSKVVKAPEAVAGSDSLQEVVCSDDTGIEHAAMCTDGSSISLSNGPVRMVKGHIRSVADNWAAVKPASEPLVFTVKEDNDVLATEYELQENADILAWLDNFLSRTNALHQQLQVEKIFPEQKGINVMSKVVKAPEAVAGSDSLKEVVCGDGTGIVTVPLRTEEHAAMCTDGSSISLPNGPVRMVKDHIRSVADKWAAVKPPVSKPLVFTVKEDNDILATEYELQETEVVGSLGPASWSEWMNAKMIFACVDTLQPKCSHSRGHDFEHGYLLIKKLVAELGAGIS